MSKTFVRGARFTAFGFLIAAPLQLVYAQGRGGGVAFIEPGQPGVVLHGTVESAAHSQGAGNKSSGSSNLYFHGGTPDGGTTAVGVETAPQIYLVFWGSQWSGNDKSNEASILQNFYSAVGGSSWLGSVTQYCQGTSSGSFTCSSGTNVAFAGNPSSGVFAGSWYDNATAAPTHPRQSQLAAEVVRAAAYFNKTTAAANASVQYVIATASGNSSTGFGSQYCAWHSSTTSSYGDLAYTNLPYMTDAGASCGANFNNLGATAGITIVSGHEMAESITDQFPDGGWLDSSGAENGDKCAWSSATSNQPMGGTSFPVQPLWSNAANAGAGGCVLSFE